MTLNEFIKKMKLSTNVHILKNNDCYFSGNLSYLKKIYKKASLTLNEEIENIKFSLLNDLIIYLEN